MAGGAERSLRSVGQPHPRRAALLSCTEGRLLIVLFPWFDRRKRGPGRFDDGTLRSRPRRMYTDWEWKQRFSIYQTAIAISRFTREYAKRWWNLDCEVVYPPTSNDFKVTAKSNTILSVGRFATLGHSKKQRRTWSAESCEGCSSSRRSSGMPPAPVKTRSCTPSCLNISASSRSTLWGPDAFRWFSTRARAEIVEHGVSGFLWDTLDELMSYTTRLARVSASADGRGRSRPSDSLQQAGLPQPILEAVGL